MNWRNARLLAILYLPGCATIVQGGGQNLTVSTNPAGANCRLERDGAAIGIVAPTPATMRIEKSKHDIIVTCNRDGHDATIVRHTSEFGGATLGNIVAGGLIGVVVDAASGANFPYPTELVVNLQVTGGPPVVQPPRKRVHQDATYSGATVAPQPAAASAPIQALSAEKPVPKP